MQYMDRTLRNEAYLDAVSRAVTFAFQPIVNIHTGRTYAVEALVRNVDKLGFSTIPDFFDYAWNAGILHRVDLVLRQMAISQYARTDALEGAKLFYNVDGRTFESADYHPRQTIALMDRYHIKAENFVLELSEGYDNIAAKHLSETLKACRQHDYRIAIDDFGRGFSEMQMLYEYQPDYIKIDRFFINGLADDSKKRLFVTSIVNLAHVLGITVLAEGVETEREFLACKSIGCDLVQGFYVARPTIDHSSLQEVYDIVPQTNSRDRRRRDTDEFLIRDYMEPLEALDTTQPLSSVFDAFRTHKEQSIFPVVKSDGEPAGILREEDLKDYIYREYGRDLLQNPALGHDLKDFLKPCPTVDINTEAERMLETYAIGQHSDGIIITDNFRYVGYLSPDALLRIINEKNLSQARDQNPLSMLPGNTSIVDYIANGLEDTSAAWSFVYFDFNDFKPFNDVYGFRQGDRAITLFAELLRETTRGHTAFLGHVGGDDFFAGFKNTDAYDIHALLVEVRDRFAMDVSSMYSVEHRETGGMDALDRHGSMRHFGLLSVSAAVIHIPAGFRLLDSDGLFERITQGKSLAKGTPDRIYELTADGRKQDFSKAS